MLVNGKRRHTSALVNVNGTVGRGSAAWTSTRFPLGAIERIEILRDGAAAQYGSDAIAGVINIILKANAPDELTAMTGQTAMGDGNVVNLNGTKNIGWGGNGFIEFAGEFRDRGYTNRTLRRPDGSSTSPATRATPRPSTTTRSAGGRANALLNEGRRVLQWRDDVRQRHPALLVRRRRPTGTAYASTILIWTNYSLWRVPH